MGQQWPQGRHASTPERPGQPSAVPSAHPPGSVNSPDEIIILGPQGGQKAPQSSTSSQLQGKDSGHSSRARGTPRLHLFTDRDTEAWRWTGTIPQSPRGSTVEQEGTLGSCLPAQSSVQLSLLGWKLGSRFGGVRVQGPEEGGPGSPSRHSCATQCPYSSWPRGRLVW